MYRLHIWAWKIIFSWLSTWTVLKFQRQPVFVTSYSTRQNTHTVRDNKCETGEVTNKKMQYATAKHCNLQYCNGSINILLTYSSNVCHSILALFVLRLWLVRVIVSVVWDRVRSPSWRLKVKWRKLFELDTLRREKRYYIKFECIMPCTACRKKNKQHFRTSKTQKQPHQTSYLAPVKMQWKLRPIYEKSITESRT